MSTERIQEPEMLLTRTEVAARLRVSVRTVDRYIAAHKLRIQRLGDGYLVRIPESEVAAFLARSAA